MEKNHNSQIKKIAMGMEMNRKNIQNGTDVGDNIKKFKDNFNDMEQQIKSQVLTIQSMEHFHHSMSTQTTRNLQAKRFLIKIHDKTKTELKAYFDIIKQYFNLPNRKTDNWDKIWHEVDKQLNNLKEQSDAPQRIYIAISKMLAVKEDIIAQFLRSMMYSKHLLWKDLGVPYENYIHSEVKNILNIIKYSDEKYGYVPTLIDFKIPKFDTEYDQTTNIPLFEIALADFQEIMEAIKNYSHLSGEPQIIESITKNQKIVKGLREKIQVMTNNYDTLLEKYRSLQISRRGQVGDEPTLSEKVEELQKDLIKKQAENVELKQNIQKSDSLNHHLREKNKQLEDEISKWQKYQLPKIKDLQATHKTISEEFSKVKKDIEGYNSIFENQRQQKNKILEELKQERNKVNGLVDLLGKEKRKVKQLKAQIVRQQQINLQLTDYLPDLKK